MKMRGRWLALPAGVGLAVGMAACGSSDAGQWSDPTKITYYPGLHVDLSRMSKTPSGVFYWDSIAGTGTYGAKPGDQVTVHYTLWLPDGTLIDNHSGQPFSTPLTNTSIIQGWVDGLTGVVQGTTRQLVIPPALGYGDAPQGSIPANTTLVFLITMDQITPAASGAVVAVQRTPVAHGATPSPESFH